MIAFSTTGFPKLDRAGKFPLVNPTFDFCYRGSTHALHLYEYDAILNVDGIRIPLRSGDVTCIAAGSIYSYSSESPGEHWCIHFHDTPNDGDAGIVLPTHFELHNNNALILEQFRLITRLFNNPHRHSRSKSLLQFEAEARLKVLLLNLFNLNQEPGIKSAKSSNFHWDEVFSLIEENLGRQITTDSLARQLNTTPGSLARKFRQKNGCTLKQYLLKKRIARAESLLTTTNLTVQEVGTVVGIGDPQYFNKQFRRLSHLSPSAYRERNKQLLAPIFKTLAAKDGHWEESEEQET